MRTFSCLAVSLTSLMIAAGPALADPSGFVSGSVGSLSRTEEGTENAPGIEGRASATFELTPTLNVQGDVEFKYARFDRGADNFETNTTLNGALHLFYREPDNYLFGGFVQAQGTNSVVSDDSGSLYRALIGLEGQVYLDDLTLYGQAGFVRDSFSYEDYTQSGMFARLEARYFLTPDFKIDIHGLVTRTAVNDGVSSPVNTIGIGAGVEYRLPESPVSIFGTADYYSTSFSSDYKNDDTRVMIGVKFNFGSDSLKDQDRNGTTLDPVNYPIYFGAPA